MSQLVRKITRCDAQSYSFDQKTSSITNIIAVIHKRKLGMSQLVKKFPDVML